MEIKRTTEVFVETKRRFVIYQPESIEQIFCPVCGEPLLVAEQAAAFFQINCRAVYQLVEAGAAHFIETVAGAMLVCPSSLDAAIENGSRKEPFAGSVGQMTYSATENGCGESEF